MHTSQTTHHRIFFTDVTKPDYLEGLCKDLGFEKIDDTTYDLALEEGTQLTVEEACRVAVNVAALGNPAGDPEDLLFMLGCIARLLADRGYVPHSTTFEADVDLETLNGVDISCLELFDLLSALSYGYKVKGIYTQWAMFSNKAEFGANAGGTRITMRSFSIPCQVYPDRAESLIDLLAKHKDTEIGDVFAMEFILPLLEKPMILTREMELSIQASLHRFFGGLPQAGLEDIVPVHLASIDRDLRKLTMKPEYQFQSPAVLRKPPQAPTLDDFRNFQVHVRPYSQLSEAQQFYIAWFGIKPGPSGHFPELPSDFELQVDNIRAHLAAGHDIECPAIHKFHNPDPIRIECEIPTIMPGRKPERMEVKETGPLDLKGVDIKGVQVRQTRPLDPKDFVNFQPVPLSGVPVDLQFYLLWYGFSIQDYLSGALNVTCGMDKISAQVDVIRNCLDTGDLSSAPPMGEYNENYIIRVEKAPDNFRPLTEEDPKPIMRGSDDVLELGRDVIDRDTHRPINRQLIQTGFEHDAKPLDPADLQDIHSRAASQARSSQSDHTYGGVPMEKTGVDYSEVTTGRTSFSSPDPSPSPVSDTSSNDSSSSSPSD